MHNIMIKKGDQRLLVLWAADCAEHVLKYFNKKRPKDKRPQKAIKAARDWASGKIRTGEARKAALAAHAAARSVPDGPTRYAARAAGHSAAVAHVASHTAGVVYYALKTVKNADEEIRWQKKRLPKKYWKIISSKIHSWE